MAHGACGHASALKSMAAAADCAVIGGGQILIAHGVKLDTLAPSFPNG